MPTISEVLAENYPVQYERAASWRERLGDLGVQEQILAELGLDVDDFASIADRRVVLGVGLTVVGSGDASGSPQPPRPMRPFKRRFCCAAARQAS